MRSRGDMGAGRGLRWAVLAMAGLALAACGVDGAPVAPEPAPKVEPGVHVSVTAQAGVKARF